MIIQFSRVLPGRLATGQGGAAQQKWNKMKNWQRHEVCFFDSAATIWVFQIETKRTLIIDSAATIQVYI